MEAFLLNAIIPASTQTAFIYAPLKSAVLLAISAKFTSGLTFIFLEWILKIYSLASSLGRGNSIFLSNLPDLKRAGSKESGLFVAAMTLISSLGLKPSN